MYSKTYCQAFDAWQLPLKIWKMMGSPALLLLVCFQASLSGNAQEVSLSVKNAPLQEVFEKINQQTGAEFLYNFQMLKTAKPVTLDVTDMALPAVLALCFKDQPLTYIMDEKTIIVRPGNEENLTAAKKPQQEGAQNRILSGTVVDDVGSPLAGATVRIQGTNVGIITDTAGKYRLRIPQVLMDGGKALVLEVSFVGFDDEAVEIGNRGVIDFVLLPSIEALMEVAVVSTGYYEVEQRLNPGNIAKVDAKTIERQPVVNPLEALQGQVSGVFIQQNSGLPGAPVDINIRGLNSLNNGETLVDENGRSIQLPNSNLPFFVIDGVPYTSTSLNSSNLLLNGGNPLAAFRPGDIERIEVLKDADATAIYGSRGANGVILITTKKGKIGRLKVDLDYSRGFGDVPRQVEVLNTAQFLEMRLESLRNQGFAPENSRDTLDNADVFLWGESRDTNWQKELAGEIATQDNASITFSGGSEQTQFLFRASYFGQGNVYKYDDSKFESVSGHLNLNHSSTDNRLNINSSVTYTSNTNDQVGFDIFGEAISLSPNAPGLFDDNGEINNEDGFNNPLASLNQEYLNRTNAFVSNTNLRFEVIPNLNLSTSLGYSNSTVTEARIAPLISLTPRQIRDGALGSNFMASGSEETWIIEPKVSYSLPIGKGNFNAIIGSTFQGSQRENTLVQGLSYQSDLFIRDIQQAPSVVINQNSFSEFRYTAVFARLNYSYNERYILNLTGRRDGSSRFGPGNQFGSFGAVGAAWIFSEESFFEDNSILSFGKLRASYGVTGNDQIGDYRFLDSYGPAGSFFNTYNGNPGLLAVRAANPNFSWEENRKLEAGLELGFLNGRINTVTSWFRNRTDNQLIGRPLSQVTGFSTVQFNLPALIENRGIEVEINTVNINTENFDWTTAFNVTRVRNELVEFPNIEDFTPFNNRYEVGRSTSGGKQFVSRGVDPLTGLYTIADLNGDGIIDIQDQQDFVDTQQDYFGGFTNSFRWKGFQLDVFFSFVKQENVLDFVNIFAPPGENVSSDPSNNVPIEVLDRWQVPGDIAEFEGFGLRNFNRGRHVSSGSARVDASFIRLQNASLSYSLPNYLINRLKLSDARLYINGQNLYVWTPYQGLDPESQGLNLPILRMVTTGIQLSF